MATVNNRTIARTVTTNDREIRISDTIFNSDTSAYTVQITWSDVVSITGTCNLHFVLGDGTTADRDSSNGVTITDNVLEFLLESALYSMQGLSCWVQFYNSNVYTPIKLVFTGIQIVPMGDTLEVPTTQPYPEWAAEIHGYDIDIGTVTTLDTGEPASASITGTFPSKILNLGLPKGNPGIQGDVGPKGDTGDAGVYIGTSEPTDPDQTVWVDTDANPPVVTAANIPYTDTNSHLGDATDVQTALDNAGEQLSAIATNIPYTDTNSHLGDATDVQTALDNAGEQLSAIDAQLAENTQLLVEYVPRLAEVEYKLELPDHYKPEIADTVNKLISRYDPKRLSYAVITDSHCGTETIDESIDRQLRAIVEISKKTDLDFIAFLGDFIGEYQNPYATRQEFLDRWTRHGYLLREANLPVMFCMGNHDGWQGVMPNSTKQEWQSRLIKTANGALAENIVFDSTDELSRYNYYDFQKKKVRVITLDGAENATNTVSFSIKQLTWFANVALNMPSFGWKVVILNHGAIRSLYAPTGSYLGNCDILEGIISAFNNKTAYSAGGVVADYTTNDNKIVAFHHGHCHADLVYPLSDLKTVFIATGSSYTSSDYNTIAYLNPLAGYTFLTARTYGQLSEALFDVFSLDSQYLVKTRFGIGEDQMAEIYRKNLAPINVSDWELGTFVPATGELFDEDTTNRIRHKDPIYVESSTQYAISLQDFANYHFVLYAYASDGSFLSAASLTTWQTAAKIYTTDPNCAYIRFALRKGVSNLTLSPSEISIAKLQVEKGGVVTPYEE